MIYVTLDTVEIWRVKFREPSAVRQIHQSFRLPDIHAIR